jgi:TPR repeat protein
MMYLNGVTVDESFKDAAIWFEKAATHNHVGAIYNLAVLYEAGYGVDQSLDKAIELYKKGADLGDEGCQAAYEELAC